MSLHVHIEKLSGLFSRDGENGGGGAHSEHRRFRHLPLSLAGVPQVASLSRVATNTCLSRQKSSDAINRCLDTVWVGGGRREQFVTQTEAGPW